MCSVDGAQRSEVYLIVGVQQSLVEADSFAIATVGESCTVRTYPSFKFQSFTFSFLFGFILDWLGSVF